MRLFKRLLSPLGSRGAKGLFLKMRHAFPRPAQMVRALGAPTATLPELTTTARIVLVGLGPAAHSCAGELYREGFRDVVVVAQDDLFGGKCVNFGCMPSEFVLSQAEGCEPAEVRESLETFRQTLSEGVRQQFAATGYAMVKGTASKVEGKTLVLADGRHLEFDRLILALGNDYPVPPRLAALPNRATIESFWSLPMGSRLTLMGEGNAGALSLADVAVKLGLVPTVVMVGPTPLDRLPSYRYFLRQLVGRGIAVHENVRLKDVTDGSLRFTVKGRSVTVEHDYVMACPLPVPRFLEIDGARPSLYDLDWQRAALPGRPDIAFLGDGAGFLTSSEAELQAGLLIRLWKYGEVPDLRLVGAMPLRFHGEQSLAMVGAEWSYMDSRWQEVDFRALGWSAVSGLEGKLWYLLDQTSGKVEAIHLCHKHAGDLISLARALMRVPVSDPLWVTSTVHPSAAEIFKVLARQALAELPEPRQPGWVTDPHHYEFTLPEIGTIDPSKDLPAWLRAEEWYQAILSPDPALWLGTFFALYQLEKLGKPSLSPTFRQIGERRYRLAGDDTVAIEHDMAAKVCRVRCGPITLRVDCLSQN